MPNLPNTLWTSDEQEFEARFQRFVAEGGLDTVVLRSEYFERAYKMNACCEHSIPYRNCTICHKATQPYMPNPTGYYGG